jgi:transposase
LPPYSPDLNPIEQAFAKLKTLLRKAAARTLEDTWKSIGNLLGEFSPDECANYLTNSPPFEGGRPQTGSRLRDTARA